MSDQNAVLKRTIPLTLFIVIFIIKSVFLSAQTTYYVSNGGNDDFDGTTELTAWQTIQKVNEQTFLPGDSILFEAGGVWREELVVNESGAKNNLIVFSRYGSGDNPKILGSELAESWSTTGTPNVWQSATALDNYSDEYYPGRIFFVDNDSASWGNYHVYSAGFGNLTQEFDYTVSGTTYYVYATSNPNSRYDAVEVTQRESCITIPDQSPQSYLLIDGIDFKFSRMWGFNAGYPAQRGATDLIFRNCTVGYIGAQPSGAAYGISVWHSNLLVENCTITDCGRRGVSVNLYLQADAGEQRNLNNIIVRNNIFKRGYHTTSLDLSSQQTSTDTIQNVYFYNNIIDDSDFGEVCGNCGSNQVFFQDGSGVSLVNNIYVEGNVFIQSTARNILFEGVDTSYVWNNTIVGHNPNITENPYENVGWNSDEAISFYQNNILYDNLPDNDLQNHGVFIYNTYNGVFQEKDYNLYYSLYPKTDRNFSAHRINSVGAMGYWNTTEWSDYISSNTLFEQHSPEPEDPYFVNYAQKNYSLTDSSAAKGSGIYLTKIVTDPFGNVDTLGKYDISGKPRIPENPSIGVYEYQNPDSSAANIVYFILDEQKTPAVINQTNHTVMIDVIYGTDVTSLNPQITTSYGATIAPVSGASRDFSTPQVYAVTSLNGLVQQDWTVTVNVAESSEADILGFSLSEQAGTATIDNINNTVNISVVPFTDVTNLSPVITVSEHATINPLSGVAQDFTSPVIYTVTAQDGTEKVWTITVHNELSSANDILSFTLTEQTAPATILTESHNVEISVENGTDLTNLAPVIEVSEAATIDPASGVSRDFSHAVIYTVTAEDNTEQIWIVDVSDEGGSGTNLQESDSDFTIYPNPAKDYCYIQANIATVEKHSVRLIDMQGRQVYISESVESESIISIPVNQLNPGIYVLETISESGNIGQSRLIIY